MYGTLVPCARFSFSCLRFFCYVSALRTVFLSSVRFFGTLVPCALCSLSSFDCFLCSALRTVFCELCLIVWYVNALGIVFCEFCLIACYVTALRTVFFEFC